MEDFKPAFGEDGGQCRNCDMDFRFGEEYIDQYKYAQEGDEVTFEKSTELKDKWLEWIKVHPCYSKDDDIFNDNRLCEYHRSPKGHLFTQDRIEQYAGDDKYDPFNIDSMT